MSENIRLLSSGNNLQGLLWKLHEHPEVWNQHTYRTASLDSPHHEADDIWVRYSAKHDLDKQAHSSVWYPVADILEVKPLVMELFGHLKGTTLGGVFITRIPPGKSVKPHIDRGFHADTYHKFALQVASAPGQAFCFDDIEFVSKPGDLYGFRNDVTHWVKNESSHDRITLIVSMSFN